MVKIRGLQRVTVAVLLSAAASAWARAPVTVTVQVENRKGAIVPGAPLKIYPRYGGEFQKLPGGGSQEVAIEASTDSHGRFTITLRPGDYEVCASAGFTGEMWAQLTVAPGVRGPVVLRAKSIGVQVEVVPVALPLLTKSTLRTTMIQSAAKAVQQNSVPVTVQLTGAADATVPAAAIQVFPQGKGAAEVVRTGADGRATVALDPGEYDFVVHVPGLETVKEHLSVTRAMVLRVELAPPPAVPGPPAPEPPPSQIMPMLRTAMISVDAAAQEQNPPAHSGTMPLHAQPAVGNQAAANVLTIIAGPQERGVFTPATLKDYPHVTVTFFNHHIRKQQTYSGVPLMDLLAPLGVPHGKTLMGKALADYIVATGSDGYRTVVALGEIDPAFHPGVVLVADTLDGKPLGAKTGPFRLVVSLDKRPARSVRNLVEIEVKRAE